MTTCEKFAVIEETLRGEGNLLQVGMLCEIASVSRSGYYRWKHAAATRAAKERQDEEDFRHILRAYGQRGYAKGARSIYMCMLHWNPPLIMNLKKIRRLMNKYGLLCPIRKANPYRRMAKAVQTNRVADNLLNREFTLHGRRRVLLTDITYIPSGRNMLPLHDTGCLHASDSCVCTERLLGTGLRLRNGATIGSSTRHRLADGDLDSQRSRLPLHEHSFQRTCKEQETEAVDVAEGKLLGQCPAGKLFWSHER